MRKPVTNFLLDTKLVDRFLTKFTVSEDCWEWQAGKFPKGYGQFKAGTSAMMAHRASYIIFVGPIPEGMEIDHRCVNVACVRPSHLEAVTPYENKRRSRAWSISGSHEKAKTHCPQGHEYSEDNTYVNQGRRNCIICKKRAARASYLRRKEATCAQG